MKLIEIFKHLTHGELSQLSLGGGSNGEIVEANYEKVVSHINLALLALHTRFSLRSKQLTVELQTGQLQYPLLSVFAVSHATSTEAVRYIRDTAQAPFLDDILEITEIKTSLDKPVPLNDAYNPYSVMTPNVTTLDVPALIVDPTSETPDIYLTDVLRVIYRANHPVIDATAATFDPERYEVYLPYSHLQALLLNVASRVNTPFGASNGYSLGDSYLSKYEAECARLEASLTVTDSGTQPNRLKEKGWV